MDTKSNFSRTLYKFRNGSEEKGSCISSNEITQNSSPYIRKFLPQTSILLSQDRSQKLSNDSKQSLLDNEIEFITFSQNEKIIATKSLRVLINQIISKYPRCRFRRDLYEAPSEVYKYCFNENLIKIKSISEMNPEIKSVILSRRHKIHKNELNLRSNPHFNIEKPSSYQLINFNQSILNKLLTDPYQVRSNFLKETSQKRIPKILKDTRQKLSVKHLIIPLITSKSCKTKPRKSRFFHSKHKFSSKSVRNSMSSCPQPEKLVIPPKLYNEIFNQDGKKKSEVSKFL
jgi:hypothetical protein